METRGYSINDSLVESVSRPLFTQVTKISTQEGIEMYV